MSSENRQKAGGGISRRDFLKGLGLATISIGASPALLSSACRGPAPPAEDEIGGTLQYLSWEGYDLRGCMEPWEEEHGVTMESTYIGDHPEIPAKLAVARAGLYDLITYYHGYWDLYRDELEIITPLEREKLPNFEALYPRFQGERWVDDEGTIWAVPFTFGVLGGNYNAAEIDPPGSWFDLLLPQFEDRFAIVDDNNAVVITGAMALGYGDKVPNLTPEELDEIMDFWRELRAKARTIAVYGDLTDLFAAGEIVATIPGWAAVNVWAGERDLNVGMYIPQEGATTFIDAYAIPPESDNRETALAWINESISPEVQACQAEALAAGVVTPDAVPLTDPEIAAMYDYDGLDELFEIAPVFDIGPRESDEYATYEDWIAAWEGVKAG